MKVLIFFCAVFCVIDAICASEAIDSTPPTEDQSGSSPSATNFSLLNTQYPSEEPPNSSSSPPDLTTQSSQDQFEDSETQSPLDATTSTPFVDQSNPEDPAGCKKKQNVHSLPKAVINKRPEVNETKRTEYPHFVKVFAVDGEFSDPNDVQLEWIGYVNGAIISEKYVLWSGRMCENCTIIVVVGGQGDFGAGGSRHIAKPIPYIDDAINMTESRTLILLKLTKPIEFGPTAQPVKMPEADEGPKSGDWGMLVGPSIYRGGSVLNLSNQSVLDQQDCNKRINSSITKWTYQIVTPPHLNSSDETRVPTGSFCSVKNSESSMFLASESMLFIQNKLAGIGYHEINVSVDPRGSFEYLFHYDIAYYREWIDTEVNTTIGV